jgi:hypothetical protein
MLLKANEGSFYKTKLVCALPSITYQLSQKTKLNSKLKMDDGRLLVGYVDSLGGASQAPSVAGLLVRNQF